MSDPRIVSFQASAEKVIQFLHGEFGRLQTGRASAALVEHIDVDAYGQHQPLKTLAGISVQDGRTIVVQPWDRSILQNVEKALIQSNLGASPSSDGTVLRISLPSPTQERRTQLVKVVQKLAEEARISLRKTRQTAHDAVKQEKDEDVRETLQKELQKQVDELNAKIAESAKRKEEEILKV